MSTKWEICFGVELPWEEIWGRLFKNLANRKSKQLQWKVIHRIIYTEVPHISSHGNSTPKQISHFVDILEYFLLQKSTVYL
jgi:hypothetical protein